jgi:hypothetical protein
MKKFNKTITVEVEVDAIAEMLLKSMAPDYRHGEMLTEAIIGTSLEKKTIDLIYNALNGYTNEINFKIDDVVSSTEDTHYSYVEVPVESPANPEMAQQRKWQHKNVPTINAVVVDINIYADKKLQVEYDTYDSTGKVSRTKEWVNHRSYTIVPK